MRYEKYDNVTTSSDKLEFQFESEGPKQDQKNCPVCTNSE